MLAGKPAINHGDISAAVDLDHSWLNVSEGQVHACVAHGDHGGRLLHNLHNAVGPCNELMDGGERLWVNDVHAAVLVAV
jgi:hypothetical protein